MKSRPRSARQRWLVIGPFLVVLALMAVLGAASTEVLTAVRAYVGGESLWSKGQKDAVYHLANYTASSDDHDYQRFRAALSVPLGDQRARLELERPDPDLAIARRGLLDGGNHPDDIEGMIWLFRHFRNVSFMAEAIDIWAEGDRQIIELDKLAGRIRELVVAGDRDAAKISAQRAELSRLNDRLTDLEQRFTAKLGDAARLSRRLMLAANIVLAIALAAAAVALSLRPLRRQAVAESALRTSEERLTRALEASGLALWDFDLESGRIFLSEAWSQRLGGPYEATRTTFAELAQLVPEGERGTLRATLIETLKNHCDTYRVEHRVRKSDGSWLWNLSEGSVVERAADGRALRMVGTNRDISERKQAEAARRALEAQLRESQKMEAIGTMAGGIAHDFNNILGVILGNVALARDELGATDPAQTSLEQINRAALRARGLVQQILAFSRRQPQELVNRPLGPIVQESLLLMRSVLPAGVRLESQLEPEPLHVLADATQMQQVLMNLCTNAWHALQGRSGCVTVGLDSVVIDADAARRIGGLQPGAHARLWVTDDGCGMDVATLSRIFEPFFTTKPAGQGTGLGLSVVFGIVAEHHGGITVDSRPGQGTTFEMYFPLVAPADVAAPPSGWGALEPLRGTGHGQRVLYVDDDEVMSLLAEKLLRRHGYRVTCYQDPVAAIASVRQAPDEFDLVVSDFNMPGCSGLDVAREIARVRPALPVVISSGFITDELRADARSAGVRGLIRKENTLEELGSLVGQILEEH
jgi:PAS domain S-box-containing protein